MAAGILSKPGTKFGPCRKCSHLDCAQTRLMAKSVCKFCNRVIGYGTRFVTSPTTRRHAHEDCVESAVFNKDARHEEFTS
jgi:hypothetical protein